MPKPSEDDIVLVPKPTKDQKKKIDEIKKESFRMFKKLRLMHDKAFMKKMQAELKEVSEWSALD